MSRYFAILVVGIMCAAVNGARLNQNLRTNLNKLQNLDRHSYENSVNGLNQPENYYHSHYETGHGQQNENY